MIGCYAIKSVGAESLGAATPGPRGNGGNLPARRGREGPQRSGGQRGVGKLAAGRLAPGTSAGAVGDHGRNFQHDVATRDAVLAEIQNPDFPSFSNVPLLTRSGVLR